MQGNRQATRVYGRVRKIHYRNDNGFVIGSMVVKQPDGMFRAEGFKGTAADGVETGEWIVLDGTYSVHEKYGGQWEAVRGTMVHRAVRSAGALSDWCDGHAVLCGLSKDGRSRLWKAYGKDAVMRFDLDGAKALLDAGCSDGDVALAETATDAMGPAPVLRSMLPHLRPDQVSRIADGMSESCKTSAEAKQAAMKLAGNARDWRARKTDPFEVLCGQWRLPLPSADEVFLLDCGGKDFDACRMARVLDRAVDAVLRELGGADYVPVDEDAAAWASFQWKGFFGTKLYRELPPTAPDGTPLTDPDGLKAFVGKLAADPDSGVVMDLAKYGPMTVRRLYATGTYLAEAACAECIAGAEADTGLVPPVRAMSTWDCLDEEQKAAVRLALKSRVSFVSGGPGTGKTKLLSAVVEAWGLLHGHPGNGNHNVMVLAPTGKAANRAKSSTGCDCAGTIARLFVKNHVFGRAFPEACREERMIEAVSKGTFVVGPDSLVVVDESSMIGIETGGKLMRLLEGCTMVFVGDADQLPPMEPGAFFRECLDSNRAQVARLVRNHRAEQRGGNKALASVARKIRDGADLEEDDFTNLNPYLDRARPDGNDCAIIAGTDWDGKPDAPSSGEAVVADLYRKFLSEGADPSEIMVLAPFKGDAAGSRRAYPMAVHHLNGVLQDVVNPAVPGMDYRKHNLTDAEGDYMEGRSRPCSVYDATGREIRIGDRLVNMSNVPDARIRRFSGAGFLQGEELPCGETGVFNGECGVVRRVYLADPGPGGKPCRVLVELDDTRPEAERRTRPEPARWLMVPVVPRPKLGGFRMDGWSLGYALTVHKSQGCEAPYVIVAMSDMGLAACGHMNSFLTRNLLFTAATRSSGCCVFVGSGAFMNKCAATPCECRFVGLKQRIRQAVGGRTTEV